MSSTPAPQSRSPHGNIATFYVYNFLAGFQLWVPIWVVYLTEYRGLSLTQVTLMESAFTLVIVASEMPTGAFADRWGRKLSLQLSALLLTVAIFLFGIAASFPVLFVSYIAWALSASFRSGADQALLYDTLLALGRNGEYQTLLGRLRSTNMAAHLLATILGAPLAAATDLALPIVASSVFGFLALLTSFRFVEPAPAQQRHRQAYAALLLHGARDVLGRPSLLWLALHTIVLAAALYPVNIFVQPFLAHHHIPVSAFVFFLLPRQLLGLLMPLYAAWATARLGYVGVLAGTFVGSTAACALLTGLDTVWAYPAFLLTAAATGLAEPVHSDYMNQRLPSERRATALSFERMLRSLLSAATLPLGGRLADQWGMPATFGAAAAFSALLGGTSLFLWYRAHLREKAIAQP